MYEQIMFNHKAFYIISTFTLLICFCLLGFYQANPFLFMLRTFVFVFLINQISMFVILRNPILMWLGNHIFGIYLLQRIPMILGEYVGLTNGGLSVTVLYFFVTLIVTLILAVLFHKITNIMSIKIFHPLREKLSY